MKKKRRFPVCCLVAIAAVAFSGCALVEKNCRSRTDFPGVMAGIWQSRIGSGAGEGWAIEIGQDGQVLNMDHLVVGPLVVADGGLTREGEDPNTHLIAVLGPCLMSYDKQTEEVNLEISVDYFEMVLPHGKLSGRLKDTFRGKLPSDGLTWAVDWRSYGWLDEADEPDVKFIDENPDKLVFEKVQVR